MIDSRAEPEAIQTLTVFRGTNAADAIVGAQTGGAYERYSSEIYSFLVRTARDADVAADLAAEAFTKLLIEERAGRWPSNPRAWLYRVATNLAISRGRRLQVSAKMAHLLRAGHDQRFSDGPDVDVLRRERQDDIDRALAAVSADARAALLLAAQGFDGATIAMTIGRSEVATRALMCRARMRLRDLLAEVAR